MKKFMAILLPVVLIIALLSVNANAFSGINAGEQQLLDYLKNNPVVLANGRTYVVPADYQTKSYNYLNRDEINLTADNAANALTEMKDLWAKCKTIKSANVTSMTDDEWRMVAKEMQDVANYLNLTVRLDLATRTISLVDRYGKVVADNAETIEKTGASSTVAIAVVAVVSVMGCALVLNKERA